ncbi:MAG: NAD(P)H-hydrate dehydratase [Gammaproteobacteria bacterium]
MSAIGSSLPHALYRAVEVRTLDRIAIKDFGIGGAVLMECAGAAAFSLLQSLWPAARRITVVCGGGNNGGDGYVVARLAQAAGHEVAVLHVTPPDDLHGDALLAANKFIAAANHPMPYAKAQLERSDIIVDALLGTGLDREVSGELRAVIADINTADIPVLSIDIPSGLHADTGQVMGMAVRADATVTFLGLKQGLFTGAGPEQTGKLFFSDLEVPPEIYAKVAPSAQRVNLEREKPALQRRSRSAHKGNFGHVLVVGGEAGFAGAARLAAEAAARMGAGLVSVATRGQHAAVLCMARPELMAHAVETSTQLSPLLARANCIAIGPGLGQSGWSAQLFARIVETHLPLVVDADALNLLAADPVRRDNWILTPHPGEAARMLDCRPADVQADRFTAVRNLQSRYGGVIVLKGSGTLILDDRQNLSVCDAGNPGMASGGMGDVLTGVIASLVAQGYALPVAARLGVCIHAAAGDAAAREGERGLLAGDLMPWIRTFANPD